LFVVVFVFVLHTIASFEHVKELWIFSLL